MKGSGAQFCVLRTPCSWQFRVIMMTETVDAFALRNLTFFTLGLVKSNPAAWQLNIAYILTVGASEPAVVTESVHKGDVVSSRAVLF